MAMLCLGIMLCAPVFSYAESREAYISYYAVTPPVSPTNPAVHLRTDITVSNITTVPQAVTITLYNYNGTPAANIPYMFRASDDGNGNITFGQAATDANGQVTFTLSAFATGGLSLIGTGINHDGFGKITATSSGDGKRGQVVAHALITDTDYASNIVYQNSITINGGNPF